MQIKRADDRQPDIEALERLRDRPGVDPTTRQRIEREIKTIRAGVQGERDAAYEIEFHYGKRTNRVTIHDLRLEVDGRVAQIDHLIIDRLLTIWVCESKHFAEGVGANDHGEWVRFWQGRPTGIPSPVEQNVRHIAVLGDVFNQGLIKLPRRLVTIKPDLRSVVLVSNNARIARPRSKAAATAAGVDQVIKVERLKAMIDQDLDSRSVTVIRRIVGEETVQRIGRELAALHRPGPAIDWAARFGMAVEPVVVSAAAPTPVTSARSGRGRDSGRVCAACGIGVSIGVARFSEENATRFAGRILCMACQQAASGSPPG